MANHNIKFMIILAGERFFPEKVEFRNFTNLLSSFTHGFWKLEVLRVLYSNHGKKAEDDKA